MEITHQEREVIFHLLLDHMCRQVKLASKAIEGPTLPLQCVYHIHCGHSLPLGMLCVGHSISDDILQEDLENTPGLLVDETTDALDTTPSCKSPDSRLGDPLDVIPQHFTVSLGSTLTQALATFASSSHSRSSQL